MRTAEHTAITILVLLCWGCMPASSGGDDDDDDRDGQGGTPAQTPMAGASGMNPGGGPNPLGTPCLENTDCESEQCVALGAVRFCSQACESGDDCPAGFACQLAHCVPEMGAGAGGGPGEPPAGGAQAPGGEMGPGGGGEMSGPGGGGEMMGSGGSGPPPSGGQMMMGGGPLCGEDTPIAQCRVACIRAIGCMGELCPHEPPDDLVELCQANCPNEILTTYVCTEGRACDSIVSRLTQSDEVLNAMCYEGPCQHGDCGAHGRCEDGRCLCSQGYTGTRCETAPPEQRSQELCGEFVECVSGCGDDEDCVLECRGTHPAGAQFYIAFQACILNNDCLRDDGMIDEACAVEFCLAEVQTCFDLGG